MCTLDGRHKRSMTIHVAWVKKAFGWVSQMLQNKNSVGFDQGDYGRNMSYVQNTQTQDNNWLKKDNVVWVIDLLAGPPRNGRPSSNQSFGRPGP